MLLQHKIKHQPFRHGSWGCYRFSVTPPPLGPAPTAQPAVDRHILATSASRFNFPHNPFAPGKDRCLRAIGKLELAQDITDMPFYRLFAEDEPRGDVAIAQAIRY